MTRVLIADDSSTARQLLRAMLESDSDIRVIGEAHDGAEAIAMTVTLQPDVIIMDVHMPERDGLEATKEIMMRAATPIIIVTAATRYRDVEISLSATQAGALLVLPKPSGPSSPRYAEDRSELVAMTKALAQVKVVRRWTSEQEPRKYSQREPKPGSYDIVAIAASTGGPAALRSVLIDLPVKFPSPIVIVQHIARGFTPGFAHWLDSNCALPVRVAKGGEDLEPGRIYIAPDDTHLGFSASGKTVLDVSPPINRFRPSADHLFNSVGRIFGSRAVCVILSGMGSDGARGLEAANQAGAFVIAQNEATSVVFGMAQEAMKRNAVDLVLPVNEIGAKLQELVGAGTHA